MKFSENLLSSIGKDAIAFIMDNIKKGVDIEGNSFAYSEKNYWRPFDPAIYSKYKKNQSFGKLITTESTGKLGFIIFGYKKFKEVFNPSAKDNYLTFSGKMLRNLNVLKNQNNQIIIGFSDPVQSQKAYWFNISGVGKSRKLWKFLGLRQEQINKLIKDYQDQLVNEVIMELFKNQKS